MAGNKIGGSKARDTNKERYGKDYYGRIGALGGKASNTGGFAWMKANGQLDKVRAAGASGGRKSRYSKSMNYVLQEDGEIDVLSTHTI